MSSDLQIALVVEGPTDLVILEAALKAILKKPFIINLLQPENPSGKRGAGWGGVLKRCWEFRKRKLAGFEEDPTAELYDLLILHLDADVAGKLYSNTLRLADHPFALNNFGVLPCEKPCPPAEDSVNELKAVITSWIDIGPLGGKTTLCIPSKSSDAWLAAAVFYSDPDLMDNIECKNMAKELEKLKVKFRIKMREYQKSAEKITANWEQVCQLCPQADAFHQDMQRYFSF
jgi:hypothetical protein